MDDARLLLCCQNTRGSTEPQDYVITLSHQETVAQVVNGTDGKALFRREDPGNENRSDVIARISMFGVVKWIL